MTGTPQFQIRYRAGIMLNWAIIGTGFISHAMLSALKLSDGSKAESIFGRNTDTLAEFQKTYDIAKAYTDFDEAINDPNIDVVYIGLPNNIHHELTIKAANAGKAVLSEKSLTTTMAQAHALVDAVQSNNTFFVEGFMYLAHPLYKTLTKVLQDGRLGDLKAINGHYSADIWQVVNPLGKGTLYNLGCYPASLLQLVVQTMGGTDAFKKRHIKAFGNTNTDGNVCDATISVKFENGVLANLQSTDSYGMAHAFSISGDKGILTFKSNPWLPGKQGAHIVWQPYIGESEDIIVDDARDGFHHQVKLVEDAMERKITQAERPSPRLSDSLEIMEFLTDWEAQCRF
jgi:predicted dehydrogenase